MRANGMRRERYRSMGRKAQVCGRRAQTCGVKGTGLWGGKHTSVGQARRTPKLAISAASTGYAQPGEEGQAKGTGLWGDVRITLRNT